jgi:hypothetical protein
MQGDEPTWAGVYTVRSCPWCWYGVMSRGRERRSDNLTDTEGSSSDELTRPRRVLALDTVV